MVLFLAGAARSQDASPTGCSVSLDLDLDVERSELTGTAVIAIVNTGTRPLDRVPLVLYPNRFREIGRAISAFSFDRYYIPRFNPGSIELERVVGPGGRELVVEPIDTPGMPRGTWVAAKLEEPVPPGGTARISVRFRTVIP